MNNFLSMALSGQGVPRPIPSIDPDTGLPVEGPIINDPTGALGIPQPEIPNNVMQAAAAPREMVPVEVLNDPAAQARPPMDLTNIMQTLDEAPQIPQQAAEPPRQRRSLLDTVGRISDVLARVGGAEALYQPSLDAREDRTRQIDLDALRKQSMEQELGAGADAASARQRDLLGGAMRGLQAIQARGGNVGTAWPILARQAGIPDDQAAQLTEIFAQDPNSIAAIAAMTGQEREFGLQPFYAQDKDGKLKAYQLGKDGSLQAVRLGEGEAPIDPLKFVDTGGAQVGVGTRSGGVRKILPNSVDPNTRANIGSHERIAAAGNRSREAVAATRGAGKEPANGGAMVNAARGNLSELRKIYGELRGIGALVSPKQSTGANVAARVRASGVGQMLEGAVGTEAQTKRDRVASIRPALMQSLAQATGMTGKQLDSNADVKLFMQTVTDPTTSYEANLAAIDGLERFLEANTKTGTAPAAAPRAPARPRAQPRRASGGAPSVSNW